MNNYPNLLTYELLETRYWWARCEMAGKILNPEFIKFPLSYEQLIKFAVLKKK